MDDNVVMWGPLYVRRLTSDEIKPGLKIVDISVPYDPEGEPVVVDCIEFRGGTIWNRMMKCRWLNGELIPSWWTLEGWGLVLDQPSVPSENDEDVRRHENVRDAVRARYGLAC